MKTKPSFAISCELFPPNTPEDLLKLRHTCLQLQESCAPDYFSVTFGAGGSNQEKTLKVVAQLIQDEMSVSPHLTCIGLKKEQIRQLLHHYQQLGINRLVTIRGDLPPGEDESHNDFEYANELVEFIRQETGHHFSLSIA